MDKNASNEQETEHETVTDNSHGRAEHKMGDDSTRSQVAHKTAYDSPRSQAFGTTEILEAIIEHLPARTLFGVQRVSKTFQATILGSQRIQHKMFLRIKNETQVPWALRWDEISEPDFEQVPGSGRTEKGARRRLLTPVDMNTSLDHVFSRRGIVTAYVDRERISELNRRRRFTKQGREQLSIGKGFISDPHCDHIEVKLSLTLGVRLPTRITVTSVVNSRTPLTIDSLIAKALDQDYSRVKIDWRCDGHTFFSAAVEGGVPRQILDRLKRQTGLELFFRFSGLSFRLFGVVAPTTEERSAVARFSEAQT
jgi:hypothetical protein